MESASLTLQRQEVKLAVQQQELKEVRDDVAALTTRMDRLARAFWAAAATFMALTISCVGIIVTVLSR